jgi:gamma-glutamyl-gamma-aminobutyrate hydrolase PuuD
MSRPLIGIGADVAQEASRDRAFVFFNYIDAIVRAGGAAVIIPPQQEIESLIESLDGVLLVGGADCDPLVYGEERHPSVKVMDPRRQTNETSLASLARDLRVPTLGICLGMQMMNVAAGGKLVQDIKSYFDDALQHESGPEGRSRHEVKVDADTKLASVIGAGTHDVNSTHHQAVRVTGENLVATAHAPDGIIEALEDPRLPFYLGVQWHPEDMTGEPSATRLFEAFVAAARERTRSRS